MPLVWNGHRVVETDDLQMIAEYKKRGEWRDPTPEEIGDYEKETQRRLLDSVPEEIRLRREELSIMRRVNRKHCISSTAAVIAAIAATAAAIIAYLAYIKTP